MKFRSVNQTRNHFPNLIKLPIICGKNTMQFLLRIKRINYWFYLYRQFFFPIQSSHNFSGDAQGVCIILGKMVSNSGNPAVNFSTTKFFGSYRLSGCSFNKRRSAQKNSSLIFDDHIFVTHRRNVCSSCCAGAHYDCNLRNTSGR